MKRYLCFLFVCVLSFNIYSQTFDPVQSWSSEFNYNIIYTICGDFNGDFKTDAGWYNDQGQWKVMLSTGKSFHPSSTWSYNQGYNFKTWVGDFNGDSYEDKLTYKSTGDVGFYIALSGRVTDWATPPPPNQFYHQFSNETRWLSISVPDFNKVLVGDFSGDSRSDIAVYYPASNSWRVYYCDGGNQSGGSFTASVSYFSGFSWNTAAYTGDFNRDGRCDIVSYVHSSHALYRGWWVALGDVRTNNVPFIDAGRWNDDDVLANSNPILNCTGDYDGDGFTDIAYYTDGSIKVMRNNTTNHFNSAAIGISGVTLTQKLNSGDFTGDGKSDILVQESFTDWRLYKSNEVVIRQVGVWYYPSYRRYEDATGLHRNLWIERDMTKRPIVGWNTQGVPELSTPEVHESGEYNGSDTYVISTQIQTMKKAGIDFAVMDLTNGVWVESPTPGAPIPTDQATYPNGDGAATNGSRIFLEVLADMNVPDFYFAVALGTEFWGDYVQCSYNYTKSNGFPRSWDDQLQKQKDAVNYVRDYIYKYSNSNPKYRVRWLQINGRPLLIETFGNLVDYPFRSFRLNLNKYEQDRRNKFPQFHERYGCEWGATYFRNRSVGEIGCVSSNTVSVEGIDTKGFWGYGGGQSDVDQLIDPKPLPYDPEIMSIMPGTYKWNEPNIIQRNLDLIDNRNGQYYIESWKQVLEKMPKRVIIGAWNNWNEELCIEKCDNIDGGTSAWKDLYLEITRLYSSLFKNSKFLKDGYYQKGTGPVYKCTVEVPLTFIVQNPPSDKPVIQLPSWLNIPKQGADLNEDETYKDKLSLFPNPSNPVGLLNYSISKSSIVKIQMFNILGEKVKELVNEFKEAGEYKTNLDNSTLSSGIYIIVMHTSDKALSLKMNLVK